MNLIESNKLILVAVGKLNRISEKKFMHMYDSEEKEYYIIHKN